MSHHLPRPRSAFSAHVVSLLLLLVSACQLLQAAPATQEEAPRADPFAPDAAPVSSSPSSSPASGSGPAVNSRGEWYQLGYQMALESRASYRLMQIADEDAIARLPRVLARMTVNDGDLREPDLALLRQGWADGIHGQPQAMTFPADQHASLLPLALKGFHRVPADIEAEKQAKEEAARLAREEAERAAKEAERKAMESDRIARNEANRKASETVADKAARWKRAVVKVLVEKGHGTGFFIGPGLLVTNGHVVDGAKEIVVELESDGSLHGGSLVAQTQRPDVALVRIAWEENEVLPLGNSDACRELEEVVMIGYPKFIEQTATYVKGSVSSTARLFDGCQCMQLDIRANPGNSGGPVIAMNGSVVGILTFGLGAGDPTLAQFVFAQHMSFALPFIKKHAHGEFTYLPR